MVTSAGGAGPDDDATTAGKVSVRRFLPLEGDFEHYRPSEAWHYPAKKAEALGSLRALIDETQPDVGFVWNLWNMSKDYALETERLLGDRVVYYMASPWPIQPNIHRMYWDEPAGSPLRNAAKRAVRSVAKLVLSDEWRETPLQFAHAPCCSVSQREELLAAGVKLQDAPVIYEGIDLDPYLAQQREPLPGRDERELNCLFVGIVAEHKGVHTAVEALSRLPRERLEHVSLTILGEGPQEYRRRLETMVVDLGLQEHVRFHARIPRSELPDMLGRFDALLLPSVWPEPLARIMQEGMAAGMVVVGSQTGGTLEAISHGEDGLLFPAEDPATLADRISALAEDADLRRRLGAAGRSKAKQMFELDRMVDDLETYLEKTVAAA